MFRYDMDIKIFKKMFVRLNQMNYLCAKYIVII